MNVYIIVVGFQAVFNHAMVRLPAFFAQAPVKYLIVHARFSITGTTARSVRRSTATYAAHFAFIDYLFGTAVKSDRRFREKYGVLGDYIRRASSSSSSFPFNWKG